MGEDTAYGPFQVNKGSSYYCMLEQDCKQTKGSGRASKDCCGRQRSAADPQPRSIPREVGVATPRRAAVERRKRNVRKKERRGFWLSWQVGKRPVFNKGNQKSAATGATGATGRNLADIPARDLSAAPAENDWTGLPTQNCDPAKAALSRMAGFEAGAERSRQLTEGALDSRTDGWK